MLPGLLSGGKDKEEDEGQAHCVGRKVQALLVRSREECKEQGGNIFVSLTPSQPKELHWYEIAELEGEGEIGIWTTNL